MYATEYKQRKCKEVTFLDSAITIPYCTVYLCQVVPLQRLVIGRYPIQPQTSAIS